MVRCPNCGSEAVREETLGRESGAAAYLFLGVVTGVVFFGLVFAVFIALGYVNRFIYPFIEYSPFILVVVLAAVLTWIIAHRIGRAWLIGGDAAQAGAPATGTAGAGAMRQHCMVCDYKWMKSPAAPAAKSEPRLKPEAAPVPPGDAP